MNKKKNKSNWMKGFTLNYLTKEEREKDRDTKLVERARIERCLTLKSKLIKKNW
jgi:hypothetical protein